MNFGSFPQTMLSDSPAQPEWQRQFETWRELLGDCGRKAGKKRVHMLRTVTLRLQAELESWQRDRGPDNPNERSARRWSKQADKLRKALSPVRDLDVYLEMLDGMRSPEATAAGDTCQASQDCLREIDKLERRLKQKRASAEKDLLAEIANRRERLERWSKQMQAALAGEAARPWVDTKDAIGELLAGMTKAAPNLSAETLHAFRKSAKSARYLAEFSAASERVAHQATLFKKMQNTAGEWHDWQTLAERARHILGSDDREGLVRLIEAVADRSLEKALDKCRRLTAQLVEQSVPIEASPAPLPPKLPVASVEVPCASDLVRYA